MLEVRLACEQWADFARAITPAVTETLFKVLREKLPDKKWLVETPGGWCERKIDLGKVNADKRLKQALSDSLSDNGWAIYVRNDNLLDLITEYLGTNTDTYDKLRALRDFESGVRNKLAHEITRSSRDALEKKGGITLDKALASLFALNDIQPGLYARINQAIIDAL
jgi:hypothetical protein